MEDDEELLRRRDAKIAEVEADIEKLLTDKFQKLENVKRLDRMLRMEIDLMRNAKNLEAQLTTCNYTFYKSIISEIEKTENPTAVLKTFKRNDVSVTVDVVTKNPNVWIKLVNRPAKTVLIEYRDGRRNGDVIAQLKQHYHVSRRFNNPKIRVIFKNGILTEMADKLSRHGIEVIGTKVDKENEEFRGKWNEAMMEKLMEENDSEWEDGEDGREEEERDIMRLSEAKNHRNGTNPSLNLDISAVMLLVTNLCEPGGADYEFEEPMLNCHVADERVEKAKGPLLEKLRGCQLIMSEAAFQRVSEIISTVGGPTEQKRFSEFLPQIERIPDQASNEVGRVAKIRDIKGVSEVTKRVFSCGEYTGTTTVTANRKFLGLSQRKGVFFDVIIVPPRPLTEQKQAKAKPI